LSLITLNFHGLGEPHERVPQDEHRYWLPVDWFEQLLDRIMRDHDPARFAFTFDDGNRSDLLAAQLLAERGLMGRFFLLVGRFDDPQYCSREDACQLVAQGMIVGLHGRHHLNWRRLDDATLTDETVTARAELAQALGAPVTEVAIPFGSYDRRVFAWLKSQGYDRIHTSDGGTCTSAASVWDRNTLHSEMGKDAVTDILQGRSPMANYWRRQAKRALYRLAA